MRACGDKMNVLENNIHMCTGCSSCVCSCPVHAIKMKEDEKGFLYPVIDLTVCIHCGLCQRACPAISDNIKQDGHGTMEAYVGKNEDDIRIKSSSGGLFSAFAKEVLKQEGIIYGAEFDKQLKVVHEREDSAAGIELFRGSKYVQSDINSVFCNVFQDLQKGKKVYFSGCPCQVAGLLSYLKIKNCSIDNLYTQDFVCHGVASPQFYRDCIKYYEKKFNSKAIKVNFRGKPRPGKFQSMIIDFENKKQYIADSTNQDLFYYHFLNNLVLRPSCFKCKYAKKNRVADITLADCFHIQKDMEQFDDRKGLSLVMINTAKGKQIFEKCKDQLCLKSIQLRQYMQPNMKNPTPKPINYDSFWSEYSTVGFISAISKYGNHNFKNYVKKLGIAFINRLGMDELIKQILRKAKGK